MHKPYKKDLEENLKYSKRAKILKCTDQQSIFTIQDSAQKVTTTTTTWLIAQL